MKHMGSAAALAPVFIGAGVFPILAFMSVVFGLGRIEPARFRPHAGPDGSA